MPTRAEALPKPVADTQCGRTKSQFRKMLLIGTKEAPLVASPSAAAGAAPTTLVAAMSNAAALASPFGRYITPH
jgi:hypothetical protein